MLTQGWRVNYEELAYVIADRVVAVPALWTGTRAKLPDAQIAPVRPVNRTPSARP